MKKHRLLPLLAALACLVSEAPAKQPGDFPRLLGMNIGKKHYDDPTYQAALAKLDVVILGFYPGWNPRQEADPIGNVLRQLKHLNPAIKIGQYTILNETYDDPTIVPNADVIEAVNGNHWWLLNAAGQKVQWTPKYHTWEINNTEWAPRDAHGDRYPQWRAKRDNRIFFQPHAEFDLWYVDNVMWRPRVTGDWDHDGKNDDRNDPRIQAAYRRGMVSHWAAIRQVHPNLPIMGNTDSDLSAPEFRQKLDGGFIEGWMGKAWSIEQQKDWSAAMILYRTTLSNLPKGAILGVNVAGAENDYRFLRYALASCLLDDGYFSFSEKTVGYSSVTWFDEFDLPLGRARTGPPTSAWQNNAWRRDFDGGIALLNPTDSPVTVEIEPGFHRFRGHQDPAINNGEAAARLTLPKKDGIILVRDR